MQREMVHEQDRGNHHHQHQHQLPRYCTGVARASKKSKPKKAPQRGLGVAQLERLLIEEQKKMEGATAAAAMPASGTAHLGGGLGPLLPMPPLPPPSPPLSLSALDPVKHPYKRSPCPQPPLPTVSTGLSLTAASTHPTEPPSNQMYSSSSSSAAAADEDREAAGVDRSWPFVFEGPNPATFRTTTAAAGKARFAARTTREASRGLPDVSPDLSRYKLRAANYLSSNASCSDRSSELARRIKSSKGNEPAYLTLNAQPAPRVKQPPAPPSNHRPELGDFGVTQPQHGSASASSSAAARPFYSFMPVGPVRCERPLSEIKADVSDGVDLELKL